MDVGRDVHNNEVVMNAVSGALNAYECIYVYVYTNARTSWIHIFVSLNTQRPSLYVPCFSSSGETVCS